MKQFTIVVPVRGYEVYTINAETEHDAVESIKGGKCECDVSEVEWEGDFYVEDEEEL